MIQEDKQLLFVELSSRLPYGVVYHRNDGANIKLNAIDVERGLLNYTDDIEERECKPYLRPLSSMTKEELDEFLSLENSSACLCYLGKENEDKVIVWKDTPVFIVDWLNKNMFDYRGLIPMGLALESTEEMYK